jgi:hypothetical protein
MGKNADPGAQADARDRIIQRRRDRWEMERDAARESRRRWVANNWPWVCFIATGIVTAALKAWLYGGSR